MGKKTWHGNWGTWNQAQKGSGHGWKNWTKKTPDKASKELATAAKKYDKEKQELIREQKRSAKLEEEVGQLRVAIQRIKEKEYAKDLIAKKKELAARLQEYQAKEAGKRLDADSRKKRKWEEEDEESDWESYEESKYVDSKKVRKD